MVGHKFVFIAQLYQFAANTLGIEKFEIIFLEAKKNSHQVTYDLSFVLSICWLKIIMAKVLMDIFRISLNTQIQGVQEKMCFSQFTATPPSPTSLSETLKALNAMRVYSHSYWLVIFCTTNSSRVLAMERWQTFKNSMKKHNI